MNEKQTKDLLEYEELKIEEKSIKERLDVLKPIVFELIPAGEKTHAASGYFEQKKRDSWTFSPEIQLQEKALKESKASAIAKGEATSNPTFFIEYRQGKPKQDLSE